MRTILAYLQKYSSVSHIIILVATGTVGLVKPDLIGAAGDKWIAYLAFGIALIEAVVIATRPKLVSPAITNGYYDTLVLSFEPDGEVTAGMEDQVVAFEQALDSAAMSSGIAEYDATDSIDMIDFVITTSDARTLFGRLQPEIDRTKLRPLVATGYRLSDPTHPEQIEQLFQTTVPKR